MGLLKRCTFKGGCDREATASVVIVLCSADGVAQKFESAEHARCESAAHRTGAVSEFLTTAQYDRLAARFRIASLKLLGREVLPLKDRTRVFYRDKNVELGKIPVFVPVPKARREEKIALVPVLQEQFTPGKSS